MSDADIYIGDVVYLDLSKQEIDICFKFSQYYLYANAIGFNKETFRKYWILYYLSYCKYIWDYCIDYFKELVYELEKNNRIEDKKAVEVLKGIIDKIHKEVKNGK